MPPLLFWREYIAVNINYHTWPIMDFQPDWKSGKSHLARWATKWHYYQSEPASLIANLPLTLKASEFSKMSHQTLIGLYLNFKFDCRWLNPVWQMIEKRMARWIILNFKFYCRWLNPIWQIIEKKMSRNFWPKHILTKTFSKQNYFPMKNFFLPNFFSGQTFLQTKFIFRPKILSDRNVFRKKLFRPIFYSDENFYRPEFFQTKNDFRLKNNSNRKKEEKKK